VICKFAHGRGPKFQGILEEICLRGTDAITSNEFIARVEDDFTIGSDVSRSAKVTITEDFRRYPGNEITTIYEAVILQVGKGCTESSISHAWRANCIKSVWFVKACHQGCHGRTETVAGKQKPALNGFQWFAELRVNFREGGGESFVHFALTLPARWASIGISHQIRGIVFISTAKGNHSQFLVVPNGKETVKAFSSLLRALKEIAICEPDPAQYLFNLLCVEIKVRFTAAICEARDSAQSAVSDEGGPAEKNRALRHG
jgi:hypothetical protein